MNCSEYGIMRFSYDSGHTHKHPHGQICERAVIEAAAKLRGKRDQKLKGNQAKAVALIWMFEIRLNTE